MGGASSFLPPFPTFLVPGAPKAGTTSLYHYLSVHPDVFMPCRKEILFFDSSFHKGVRWYRRHFEGASVGQAVGDVSPSYMANPLVPRRVARLLPDTKLLFLVRSPVERAYSHYWDLVGWGHRGISFREMLGDPLVLKRGHGYIEFDILDTGFYSRHIENFLKFFPRRQVGIFFFEDLKADTSSFMEDVFEFLGLRRIGQLDGPAEKHNARRTNRSKWLGRLLVSEGTREFAHRFVPRAAMGRVRGVYEQLLSVNTRRIDTPPIAVADRDWLLAKYDEDIRALESLTGRDLSHWREGGSG